jgi:transposase
MARHARIDVEGGSCGCRRRPPRRGGSPSGRRAARDAQVAALAAQVEELRRRLDKDSGTSSKPPSSDSPYKKKPRDRSLRGTSGRKPGAIIAETGLDMTRFPTAAHLVSWAGLAPVTRQSGPRSRKPGKGQGDAYLKGYCTQAATGAARTGTFLGERLRRLSRRIGPLRARCAVARSILTIIWHLLNDPAARFRDLGADWHERRSDRDRKIRAHLRQLQALGLEVTINTPAA